MIRIAQTENGWVRGLPASDPRITSFKGIPFAKPPVGKLRWKAPQPCEDWEGVKDAFCFAPAAMQDVPGLGDDLYSREWHVDSEIPISEDCLYLNVWTNAKSPEERLPVLVWFFGGGFQWGYPAEMEFDGERLARRGVVVVSVNYRLGALGFLAHPDLTKEDEKACANFGLLDQQAGLYWVKRNITAFGGDPENVTIAGQSAGGASVMAQMACLENKGYFQRATVFSGIFRGPYGKDPFITPKNLSEAEKLGEEFFKFLGVSSMEEARLLSAETIRDRYAVFAQSHPRFSLIIDGTFLKKDPYQAFVSGDRIKVPVLAGNTADEFGRGLMASDFEELKVKAEQIFGQESETYLSFVREMTKEHSTEVGAEQGYAPVNDVEYGVKSAFLSEPDEACYYYKFDTDIPGEDQPGTFHSVDLWFFFETLSKCHRPFVGRHYDLSRQMCNYWANFIKSGNPNGTDQDGSVLPKWDCYEKDNRAQMIFSQNGPSMINEESEFSKFLLDSILNRIDRGNE